jgi:class 3 adenylate cyclase
MPFRHHLPPDDITALHKAAVGTGLTAHRDTLLAGIAPSFVAGLPINPSPAAQILTDLHTLNSIETLADGTVPLRSWLMSALTLTSSRSESAAFQRALDKLPRNALAAAPPASPSAPAPSPARSPLRPPVAAFPATAAFLSIAALKSMDGPEVQAALSTLHRELRSSLAPLALPDVRILSSLTGAIVLVPDGLNRNVHEPDLLPAWLRAAGAAGLAVRAGVARGMVETIEDADGTLNAIGRCLNVAARLATSDENPGALYEEPYAAHVQSMLLRTHFLHPKKRVAVQVKGKRAEVFTCFADPDAAPRPTSDVRCDTLPPFVNAVLIAYDLPDFSDGDLRTLASRFRAVVREVQRLREEHSLPDGAGISFSPGGDGGVLSLTQVPPARAFGLASDLALLLEAAGTTQSPDAPVRARLGVHYGQVLPYENAEGVARPTGLALFDADGLAGDAEARRYDAIVVSGALIESAADGARKLEASRFQEIAPFVTPHETTIRRFVPRDAAGRAAVPREQAGS